MRKLTAVMVCVIGVFAPPAYGTIISYTYIQGDVQLNSSGAGLQTNSNNGPTVVSHFLDELAAIPNLLAGHAENDYVLGVSGFSGQTFTSALAIGQVGSPFMFADAKFEVDVVVPTQAELLVFGTQNLYLSTTQLTVKNTTTATTLYSLVYTPAFTGIDPFSFQFTALAGNTYRVSYQAISGDVDGEENVPYSALTDLALREVPEPSTLVSMAIGAAALLYPSWRRRKNARGV